MGSYCTRRSDVISPGDPGSISTAAPLHTHIDALKTTVKKNQKNQGQKETHRHTFDNEFIQRQEKVLRNIR